MEKPLATIGTVENGTLVFVDQGQQVMVTVGTISWYEWLETATTFTFVCEEGTFTAHKARAGNRRGGWYWRAYRCQQGRIFRCYLGVSANLTLSRLREAASRLVVRSEGTASRNAAQDTKQEAQSSTSSAVPIPLPIVITKCAFPRLPVQHVPRARLVALLEKGATLPLVLVAAPAGSGKTTLLAEWARSTTLPVAWLSLEPADSDPLRFLAYVLTALHILDERIGQDARRLLSTNSTPDLEECWSSLVNDLDSFLTTDAALVLDDYQVLESEAVDTCLLFLLEHLPPRLHLVLGTRVDPPLPLARLRAHGQVSEISAAALRFVTIEMQFFLHQMDVDLDEEATLSLEERTEGWIAGVQLAALALRGRADQETFLHGFRGTHRFLLEYISEEILDRLTPQVRAFLLQTSILERMSGSLCDAVTASMGGQAILEQLRKANLFVSALDDTGEWYRYHALFAEGLRHHLLQQEPQLFSVLCSRASAWYEAQEMLLEACEYALQARDYTRAVPLIERQVGKLIERIQFPLLRRWLDQLPPEIIASRPLLGVASTWALLTEDDQSEQLAQMVVQLQQRFQEGPSTTDEAGSVEARANLNFMRVLQAMGNNDAEGALEVARQTLQALPEDATSLRRLASVCLNLAQATAYRLSGDYAAAERVLIEAGMQVQATNYHFLNLAAMAILTEIYEGQGELQKLEGLYQGLLQMIRAYKEAPPEIVLWIYIGYAKLFLDWNRLDEAEDAIQIALAAYQRTQIKDLALACRFVQLWISQARGRKEETQELLQKMEKDLSTISLTQPVVRFEALWLVRLRLRQGKEDEAVRWLSASGLSSDDPFTALPDEDFFFVKYTTLARVLIAQGRRSPREAHLQHALSLLKRLCAFYEQAGFKSRVIEVLVLTSLALQARGETQPALATLGRALSLAEPTGIIRLFADEGEVMACLLAKVSAYTTASPTYLYTLQAAISSAQQAVPEAVQAVPRQSLIDPLSQREQEVLQLMAAGFSNQQIADRLVISLNTAKRHVKHILAKLTATNRTQAVTLARDLHLL
jgi:LuxR family transcriptional regulator, maltose regulon positive regulatory protein